jgi:hypothetical protein
MFKEESIMTIMSDVNAPTVDMPRLATAAT